MAENEGLRVSKKEKIAFTMSFFHPKRSPKVTKKLSETILEQ